MDIRANVRHVLERAQAAHRDQASEKVNKSLSQASALIAARAAVVNALRSDGVIDDASHDDMRRALATAADAELSDAGPFTLVKALDERADAVVSREIAGALTLGSTRTEIVATAFRLLVRDRAAQILTSAENLRGALLTLADAHAVTVMPAAIDRRVVSPTTLAHYLSGVIGPLRGANARLGLTLTGVDRSPLGSALLAGDVFTPDRMVMARALAFAEPIENTFDALADVEDVASTLDAAAGSIATARRFVGDLLTWVRTDPTSFFIDERWESFPEPNAPALSTPTRVEALYATLQTVRDRLDSVSNQLREQPYGPLGSAMDVVAPLAIDAMELSAAAIAETAALVSEAVIVNRAWLGNRAGRGYSTAADLAPFLMQEEGLTPTASRQIAALVVSRLREMQLEASAVTPDMIDSAALMVIGREVKPEMEALGRYLAPRRYLERRDVAGSPAPERTRSWLANERTALERDRTANRERHQRWTSAVDALLAGLRASDD